MTRLRGALAVLTTAAILTATILALAAVALILARHADPTVDGDEPAPPARVFRGEANTVAIRPSRYPRLAPDQWTPRPLIRPLPPRRFR